MLDREWISREVQWGYLLRSYQRKQADDHQATTPLGTLATGYYLTLTYLLKENDRTTTEGR